MTAPSFVRAGCALKPARPTFTPTARIGVGAIAVLAGALLGAAAGLGISQTMLLMGLFAPFVVMVALARPHWAAVVYIALVYADLLSIMVRYDGMPALARFAGVAILCAALGYRLFVQRTRPASDRVTLWVLAYGAVVALGLLYARAPDIVMADVIEFVRNLFTYLIIINIIITSSRLHASLYALLGTGSALASLTIFQYVTGTFDNEYGGLAQYRVSDIAGATEGARPGGTLGDANYYGQLLLILIPIALYLVFEGRSRLGRLAGLGCAGVLTVGVILTYSRGDAIALGAIAIAAVIYRKPRPVWIVGGLAALALAVPLLPANYIARMVTVVDVAQGDQQIYNQDDSILGRTGATQAAIAMFLDHPILGVGRENYPLYQLDYLAGTPYARVAKGIPPHDLYLEVAAENGTVGIIVFAGLLVATFVALADAWKRFRRAGRNIEKELMAWLAIMLIGYLVSALSLHGAFIYVLFLQISLIVAARQISRNAKLGMLDAESLGSGRQNSNASTTQNPPFRMPNSAFRITAELQPSDSAPAPVPGTPEFAPLWLAAAEHALSRGDTKVARVMVEMALEHDPYDEAAWSMSMPVLRAEQALLTQVETAARPHGEQESAFLQAADVAMHQLHEISEHFCGYWHARGGVRIFGYPVSACFAEVDATGNIAQVQYFERARLEHHPDRAGTPFEVVSGNLGLEVAVRGTVAIQLPPGLEEEKVIFTAQGAAMPTPGKFYAFWEANGGPGILGYPVTPLLVDADNRGRELAVQYLEKARLEYHPLLAGTPYEVQVSRLGIEVFEKKYGRQT